MEHVLHPAPVARGGRPALRGGTYALTGGPHIVDAVHGTMTTKPSRYLGAAPAWEPVSDRARAGAVKPHAWAQVYWRDGSWAGAASEATGDASGRADSVAVPTAPRPLWRATDEAGGRVRAVAIGDGDVYASRGGRVDAYAAERESVSATSFMRTVPTRRSIGNGLRWTRSAPRLIVRGRVAAASRLPRGSSVDGSRRRRGCLEDRSWTGRGGVAAGWTVDGPRRRHGCCVDRPWTGRGAVAAAARIVRRRVRGAGTAAARWPRAWPWTRRSWL